MEFIQEGIVLRALELCHTTEPYLRKAWLWLSCAYDQFEPFLRQGIHSVAHFTSATPALLTFIIFVVVMLLMIQILSWMRSIIAFWVRLMLRLTFWTAMAALIAFVWQRGLAASLHDIETGVRQIMIIYRREYARWENHMDQTTQGRAGRANAKSSWL